MLEGEPPGPTDPPSGCRFHTRCRLRREVCSVEPPVVKETGEGRGPRRRVPFRGGIFCRHRLHRLWRMPPRTGRQPLRSSPVYLRTGTITGLSRDIVRRVSEFLVDAPLVPQTGRQLPLRRGISIGDQYLVVTVRR
ncbi:hypothetical protein [Dactylosporangium sp. NBC_01737]|uniref:hypothetical protein n=1 Tax=Dactylosporangium sp. NBC_01737 TaxID=2975959 RepID=UPI003FA3A841